MIEYFKNTIHISIEHGASQDVGGNAICFISKGKGEVHKGNAFSYNSVHLSTLLAK